MLAAARAVGATSVERFTHGTTIATNALLERRGARTAFVATAGFEHLLHLRRQTRAHLYRLCARASASRSCRSSAATACASGSGPDGRARAARPRLAARRSTPRRSPSACSSRSATRRTSAPSPTSCGGGCPDAHVVASHEVAPEFREYERASTTAADAYLGPVTSRVPARARRTRAARRGLPEPLVMRSSGGVATLDEAAAHPASIARLRAGRGRGRRGARRAARRAFENAISFDMGGTSTDVCLIAGRRAPSASRERVVAGLPIRLPTRRPAHRRRGRRLDRLARRGRRAARRARERRAPIPGRPATAAAARGRR